MQRLLLIVLPLLLIVGCSKPVEDSTLINKDGVMYLPNSDKPYTGEVFRLYDTGEKEYQGTYENGLLIEYSYLNKDGSVKEPVNMETLINRGGNLFETNGQEPYTGEVFELYDNGNRKLSGKLKGGIKDGLWTIYYENGPKSQELTYKYGKLDVLVTDWYENGQKKSEGYLLGVNKVGKWIGWYENGKLYSLETYKDGKPHGIMTFYHENGRMSQRFTIIDGTWDGLTTWWDRDGRKRGEETYKDGDIVSRLEWNVDGSVKE